jgi:hypothetical protein
VIDYPIDAAAPSCFDIRKALLTKRRWFSGGGRFMRGGKYYFSVAKADVSPRFDRKSPNSLPKKANGVERKNVRRRHIFKSDNWYESAALSMAISANHQR